MMGVLAGALLLLLARTPTPTLARLMMGVSAGALPLRELLLLLARAPTPTLARLMMGVLAGALPCESSYSYLLVLVLLLLLPPKQE